VAGVARPSAAVMLALIESPVDWAAVLVILRLRRRQRCRRILPPLIAYSEPFRGTLAMGSEPRIVRAQDQPPQAWRNGGGQTRELLVWPGRARPATAAPGAGAYPWRLRISLADVSRGGPFSAYPGVQRWFAVVEGAGVRLAFPTAAHRVDAQSAPLHFGGELPVDCELLDGPTRDLNLMTAGGTGLMRPARAGRLWRSALPLRGLFTRVAGTWSDDHGRRRSLAAQSLLWVDGAAGSAWDFLPGVDGAVPDGLDWEGDGAGPPGWWLGYAPEAGITDQ